MSSFGRSRNNIDTRLIGFPHRDAGMRGGNDIAILRQFGCAPPFAKATEGKLADDG